MPQTSPLAKKAYSPELKRESETALKVLVTSAGRTVDQDVGRDRCGKMWSTDIMVIIVRTLEESPTDPDQPANYDVVDACVENAEYIAESLGNTRTLNGGPLLMEIDHTTLVADDWLRQSTVFVSEISLRYSN